MALAEIESNDNKRRVRFSDVHETLVFDQDSEKEEVWVSPQLCSRNKEEAYRQGRRFARQGWDNLLEKSFTEETKEVQHDLYSFVQLGDDQHTPRGIERHISAQHADDRRFQRCSCIETVVDMYIYLRRKGESSEAIQKELAELSLEKSEAAAKFARKMGLADQVAALDNFDTMSTVSSSDASTASTFTKQSMSSRMSLSSKDKSKSRASRLTRMLTGQSYNKR